MQPLFPVPLLADLKANRWGASGRERVLVRGDQVRPSRRARLYLGESLELGRPRILVSVDHLEEAYCDTIARAWFAAHRQLFRLGAECGTEEAIEFLAHFVLQGSNRQWRLALARWINDMIRQPHLTGPTLDTFTPREYVRAMCELLGADHPYAHEGPNGAERANAEGFLWGDGRIERDS